MELFDITSKEITTKIGSSQRLRGMIDRMSEEGILPEPITGEPRYLLTEANFVALLKERASNMRVGEENRQNAKDWLTDFGIDFEAQKETEGWGSPLKVGELPQKPKVSKPGKRRPNKQQRISTDLIAIILSFAIVVFWASAISYFGTELMVRVNVKMHNPEISTQALVLGIRNYSPRLRFFFHFLFFMAEMIALRLAIESIDVSNRDNENWVEKTWRDFWEKARIFTMFSIFIGSGAMVVFYLNPRWDQYAPVAIGVLVIVCGMGTAQVMKYLNESFFQKK